LRDVVNILVQQSGTDIVIYDDANLDKKITVTLTDVSLKKALDIIVKNAGVSYTVDQDGIYIIGGSAFLPEPAIVADEAANALPPIEPVYAPPAREPIVTKIQLIHSKPSELLRLTGWNGRNPQANCEPNFPDRLKGVQGPAITNPGGGVHRIDPYGNFYEPASAGVRLQDGQPVAPTYDPRMPDMGAGRTADAYTGAGQYARPTTPRVPGYQPGATTRATAPGTTSPEATTAATSATQGFLWPEGIDEAQPFDLDNSIIVMGSEDGIEKFKKIVRMLDVPPKQVQIKAEFVEVSVTDVKAFGIDWSLQTLDTSSSTTFGPIGNVALSFASGNLTAELRTQLTSNIGRVINSPIISTINNQNAFISINRMIPYWITINTIVGVGDIIQQSTPQFITIDTSLMIMPRVNGDNTITMTLMPQVSDTGNQVTGPDGTVIPEQRNQQLFTQRRMANGETIVLGGFIRKNDSNSIQKIPILGELPIIGSLFRTTTKTKEDRELLIFITATILPDPAGGTVGTGLAM
ncbi:MAG: hypothetical protein A2Z18_07370, partial [Armatimonadetes bacterium RBG_16_58_9]